MWYVVVGCGYPSHGHHTTSMAILDVRISSRHLKSHWRRRSVHYIQLGHNICVPSTDAGTCRRSTQHDHPTRKDGIPSNQWSYSRQCNVSQSVRFEDITGSTDGRLQSRLLVLFLAVLCYHITFRLGIKGHRQARFEEGIVGFLELWISQSATMVGTVQPRSYWCCEPLTRFAT